MIMRDAGSTSDVASCTLALSEKLKCYALSAHLVHQMAMNFHSTVLTLLACPFMYSIVLRQTPNAYGLMLMLLLGPMDLAI